MEKQINSIEELVSLLKTTTEFLQDVRGSKYNVTSVSLLRLSLQSILGLIEKGELSYMDMTIKKVCPNKINGSCPLPNVHCSYPKCEE